MEEVFVLKGCKASFSNSVYVFRIGCYPTGLDLVACLGGHLGVWWNWLFLSLEQMWIVSFEYLICQCYPNSMYSGRVHLAATVPPYISIKITICKVLNWRHNVLHVLSRFFFFQNQTKPYHGVHCAAIATYWRLFLFAIKIYMRNTNMDMFQSAREIPSIISSMEV